MASNEEDIQEDILTALKESTSFPVVEGGIPDSQTIEVDERGRIKPYVSIQFGDPTDSGNMSFAGVRSSDYDQPVYVQTVAGSPKLARQIRSRISDAMIGLGFDWTGEVRKRPGGGVYDTVASNQATEAYVAATSFTVPIQWESV